MTIRSFVVYNRDSPIKDPAPSPASAGHQSGIQHWLHHTLPIHKAVEVVLMATWQIVPARMVTQENSQPTLQARPNGMAPPSSNQT